MVTQSVSDAQNLPKGKPLLSFNKGRASRFGVLPKHAQDASSIHWFELPAMFAFHAANAWQEGGAIRLFACVFDDKVKPMLCSIPAALVLALASKAC